MIIDSSQQIDVSLDGGAEVSLRIRIATKTGAQPELVRQEIRAILDETEQKLAQIDGREK